MLEKIIESFQFIAFQHLWQSAFVAILVFVIIKLYPKITSETRSWLWLSAFVLAVTMPLSIFLPIQNEILIINYTVFTIEVGTDVIPLKTELLPLFYYWGGLIWLAGIVVQLLRLVKSIIQTRAIISNCKRLPKNISAKIKGFNEQIKTYYSTQITSPLVTGFSKQIVLIPEHMLTTLSSENLSQILYHEYAHVDRNDVRIMVIQKILSAIFWWNPILHLIVSKLNQSREMACDERAVLCSGEINKYAQSLLASAEQVFLGSHPSHPSQTSIALGIFNLKTDLTKRIERIKTMKTQNLNHHPAKSFFMSFGFICIALATAYVLTPRLANAEQPANTSMDETRPSNVPISYPTPSYPRKAFEENLEGYVIVVFDITEEGKTTNVVVLQSSNEIFNASALKSARGFIFQPNPDGAVLKNIRHQISYSLGE